MSEAESIDRNACLMAAFMAGFSIALVICAILFPIIHKTYKEGQVDCINGNIVYCLEEQEDGSTDWETCE